jgi:ribosomal protein L7/L12
LLFIIFSFTAPPPPTEAAAAAPPPPPPPEEVKTHFDVVLSSVEDMEKNKLKLIKAIRGMKPEDSLIQVEEFFF